MTSLHQEALELRLETLDIDDLMLQPQYRAQTAPKKPTKELAKASNTKYSSSNLYSNIPSDHSR